MGSNPRVWYRAVAVDDLSADLFDKVRDAAVQRNGVKAE